MANPLQSLKWGVFLMRLSEVEMMAKNAECPCCHKKGNFSVMMNVSFRDKETQITCQCNHCRNTLEVRTRTQYILASKTTFRPAA